MPNIRPLTAELQRTAIEELNEVPDRLDADIAALRTWIEQQPHLRARTDDQFLVGFLRGSKFSLEKAKSKLDKYYTLCTHFPDIYTVRNMDSKRVEEILQLGVAVRLPLPLNDNGPRLIYVRPGCYDTDKYTFDEIMAVSHVLSALSIRLDDYAIVHGNILLLDFTGYTTAHLMQMTPSTVKKMFTFALDAMPVRDKGRHMINTNSVFEMGFNMMRSLLPAKQQNRIWIHGSKPESLYEQIPQKYLPTELGGEQGSFEQLRKETSEIYTKWQDYVKDEENYGVDEVLRPGGQCTDYNSLFGVDGSFRKLDID